jgi:anti-sigma regulatory factor (Ser/Thr protein kinase)
VTKPPFVRSVPVPNRLDWLGDTEAFIVGTARALSVAPASDPLFGLAVHEALTNAVRHGNKDRPDASIQCEVELAGGWFTIRIFDDGPGFSLSSVRALQIDPERIDALSEDGFGLPIIRSVFPTVRTISRAGRFGLELTMSASGEASPSSAP